jgi:carboxyl-terminal processing protease
MLTVQHLTKPERAAVYDKTVRTVNEQYFDPEFNGLDWQNISAARREDVINIDLPDDFERSVHDLLRQLGTSHTGFFHESLRRVPARLAIGSTFQRTTTRFGERWMTLDVHPDGPAHQSGLKPMDILLSVDGRTILPPEQPMFAMAKTSTVVVHRRVAGETIISIDIPKPRSRRQPHAEPRSVNTKILNDEIGLIKIVILPGLIGIDVAKEIDSAIKSVSCCRRLILDLRGHMGGGLAVLRVMSHLSSMKIPIGYTITRKGAERGYVKERLRQLDRIPSNKIFGIVGMILRYGGRDLSIALHSEGLGSKPWHGRIAILTNEHTVSAGEMICAFAKENSLATLVGTETAGRLIPGSGFKVGHGYMAIMPRAKYVTWAEQIYEGKGITPDLLVPWDAEAHMDGIDNQLEVAINTVKSL